MLLGLALKSLFHHAARFELHPTQIQQWKRQLVEGSKDVFGASEKGRKHVESEVKELHAKIGQLTMERDFLSRTLGR